MEATISLTPEQTAKLAELRELHDGRATVDVDGVEDEGVRLHVHYLRQSECDHGIVLDDAGMIVTESPIDADGEPVNVY